MICPAVEGYYSSGCIQHCVDLLGFCEYFVSSHWSKCGQVSVTFLLDGFEHVSLSPKIDLMERQLLVIVLKHLSLLCCFCFVLHCFILIQIAFFFKFVFITLQSLPFSFHSICFKNQLSFICFHLPYFILENSHLVEILFIGTSSNEI